MTVLVVASVLTFASTASAVYYITGWQTNSGFNSIDGVTVYRTLSGGKVTAAEWPGPVSRDVGVRGKGVVSGGGSFEVPVVTWAPSAAAQTVGSPYSFTALKVYHGVQ